ncbi:MAG: response regulator [Deinococcus-Thermus bacterium]|jgi:CheY-like chemotaxis protein|nr:response regulator [Deinococcota bacterium]
MRVSCVDVTPTDPERTVLVADDQAGQRAVIDMLLSLDGLTTVAVSDGREALDWLKANTPDLAILDVKMPHVDGLDVCYRMKRIRRLQGAPVVILTGMRDEATLERARAVGADAVVRKPLEGKDFRATVARLLSDEPDAD